MRETIAQSLNRRFGTAFDHGNILIVSHGHTLRLLLALLNGATWQNHRDEDKSVSLINTSISVVHYDDENGFHVEKINDADHLK